MEAREMAKQIYTMYSEEKKRIVLSLWHDRLPDGFSDGDGTARLLLITRGDGSLITDECNERFSDGDLFIIDSGRSFSVKASDACEAFLVKFNISDFIDTDFKIFTKEIVAKFISRIEASVPKLSGVHINAKKIQSSLFMILSELENQNACSHYVVRAYMGLILSHAIQYLHDELDRGVLTRSAHYAGIERSLVFINENLSEKITLDELARVAGMGKTGFSAAFKDITGMTVWEYILNARVALASSYLIEKNDLNVTEISLMCGFNDNAHFAKIFKKIKGSTPSEFKKKSNNPCF